MASPDASLLRWAGDRFARTAFVMTGSRGCCPSMMDVADTDGLPGEEVLLFGFVDGVGSSLHRLTVRGTTVSLETARRPAGRDDRCTGPDPGIRPGDRDGGRFVAGPDRVVVAAGGSSGRSPTARPGGRSRRSSARARRPGSSSPRTRRPDRSWSCPATSEAAPGRRRRSSRDRRASSFGGAFPTWVIPCLRPPYFGVLPDGLPGVAGRVRLRRHARSRPTPTRRPWSPPRRWPSCRTGSPWPEWGRMAAGRPSRPRRPTSLRLASGGPTPREDLLSATPAGALHLASAATLTEVEADLGRLSPTLHRRRPRSGAPAHPHRRERGRRRGDRGTAGHDRHLGDPFGSATPRP